MAKQPTLKVVPQFPEYSIDAKGAVYRNGNRWDDMDSNGVTLYGPQSRYFPKSELADLFTILK